MRTLLASASLVLCLHTSLLADTVAQWDFNSIPPDSATSTGATTPSVGSGTAALIGGTSEGFVAGCSQDPAPSDNSSWNISHFPAAGAGNKSGGVQFSVSTVGFENIVVSWYQQNSSTATRYARFQYTTDGVNYADAEVIAIYKESSWTNQTVDLSAVPGVTNNPNFAFRLVAEFESTALGAGTAGYVSTKDGSTYSTGGTIHFDMVTVSGTPFFDGNTRPFIFPAIEDQTVRANQSTPPLPFTVLDAEDPAASLTLSKGSSDLNVVPLNAIAFGGAGASRTVTVTGGTQPGSSLVTVFVTDSGGKSNSLSFNVTVLPANTAPYISAIGWTNTLVNVPAPVIAFTVGDYETPASSLSVSGTSANPALVPDAAIVFGGSASNRTVQITPAAGQTGVAPITLAVSDGTNVSTTVFALMVTPDASVICFDPLSYADGSVVTNSGYFWDRRAGTSGQCQVAGGQLRLTSTQTEDVIAPLVGSPYARSNGTVLYASFKVKFLNLPGPSAGYFAHFANGSYLRCRVYSGATNAGPGCFRLGIANGADAPVQLPADLSTNVFYTVVTRYAIDTALSTLWVNPAGEGSASVSGTDLQSPVPVSTYGFRQDADIDASLVVDDVRVGMSFGAVIGAAGPSPVPLSIERNGPTLRLTWPDPAFALQAAPNPGGVFTNVPGAASPFSVPPSGPRLFFRLIAN